MKTQFEDILEIEDVYGAFLIAPDGKVLFQQVIVEADDALKRFDWRLFSQSMKAVREAELVFDAARLYIRRSPAGMVVVVMGRFALIAMVRLNVDILMPTLDQPKKKGKGLGRFFR
jgi:hypothetical protein